VEFGMNIAPLEVTTNSWLLFPYHQ